MTLTASYCPLLVFLTSLSHLFSTFSNNFKFDIFFFHSDACPNPEQGLSCPAPTLKKNRVIIKPWSEQGHILLFSFFDAQKRTQKCFNELRFSVVLYQSELFHFLKWSEIPAEISKPHFPYISFYISFTRFCKDSRRSILLVM